MQGCSCFTRRALCSDWRIGRHWAFSADADADELRPKHEVLGGSQKSQCISGEVASSAELLHT